MLTTLAHVGPMGFGLGFFPFFFLIPLFWFVIVGVLFAVFGRRWRRRAWQGGHYGPWGAGARSAESTLAERFAQGDIDEVEYRARLEVLRANAAPPV